MHRKDYAPQQQFSRLRNCHTRTGFNGFIESHFGTFLENQFELGIFHRFTLLTALYSKDVFCDFLNIMKCVTGLPEVKMDRQKCTSVASNEASNSLSFENESKCNPNKAMINYNNVGKEIDSSIASKKTATAIASSVLVKETMNDNDDWCDDNVPLSNVKLESSENDGHSRRSNASYDLFKSLDPSGEISWNGDSMYMMEDWESEYVTAPNGGTDKATNTREPWIWKPEFNKRQLKIPTLEEEVRNSEKKDCAEMVDYEGTTEVEPEREYVTVESHPRKIYVSNINFRTTVTALWQCLEDNFGKLQYCKILRDRKNRSKGRGFAMFADISSIKKVLALANDIKLDKRVLKFEMATWKRFTPNNNDTNSVEKYSPDSDESTTHVPTESWDDYTTTTSDTNANLNSVVKDTLNNNLTTTLAPTESWDDEAGSSNSAVTSIDKLNEYTMLHIFSYLSWTQRVQCERVCKKWRTISLKQWKSMTELSFNGLPRLSGVSPRFIAFTDRILKNLLKRGCPVLETLDLSLVSRTLGYQSLELIGKECPQLKKVDLSGICCNNRALKSFAESCPNIEVNILPQRNILLQKYRNITRLWYILFHCKKLKYINLEGNRRILGKCFQVTQQQVHTLVLTDCSQLSDDGLERIGDRGNTVQELYLSGCPGFTDRGVRSITEKCSQIRILEMMGHKPRVSASGLTSVAQLHFLEELDLNSVLSVSDTVLEAISRSCTLLRKLSIQLCWKEVTNFGVAALANCSLLEDLDVGYLIKITDLSLHAIAVNNKLKRLQARGCSLLTDEGVQSVITLCPNLELLDVCGCQLITLNIFQAFVKQPKAEFEKEDSSECLNLHIGGTGIEEEDLEVADKPGYVCVHFRNLCVDSFRPDREIQIYMGHNSSEDEDNDEFDFYDMAEDYLENDDPLYEEQWNVS